MTALLTYLFPYRPIPREELHWAIVWARIVEISR